MRRLLIPLMGTLLTACASAPMPTQQAVPQASQYTPGAALQDTAAADVAGDIPGGQAQQFSYDRELPAQWWTLFRSSTLNALVDAALQDSPSLAQAQARLRQAQEQLQARDGATKWPRVDAKLNAYRVDLEQDVPGLPLKTPLNLYLASVGVSYNFDLFGANRQALAALKARVDVQGHDLQAARLMLAGNVVTTAIRAAALREQIAQSEAIVDLKTRQLAISERLLRIGTLADTELAARRQSLAQARAALPALRAALEQAGHRLAVLSGKTPDALPLSQLRLADLQLPTELPVRLPSELARRRPDIRAAQALLDEAGAQLGVATANLYPQITLSANLGELASSGQLFSGGSGFALLGAQLTQPIFHGGELRAQRRAALAAWDAAQAGWRQVVLQGLQEVADVLRALQADADRLRENAQAAQEAQAQLQIASRRQQAGGISEYALLEARQNLHSALLAQSQTLADRHADTAALFQALGGW